MDPAIGIDHAVARVVVHPGGTHIAVPLAQIRYRVIAGRGARLDTQSAGARAPELLRQQLMGAVHIAFEVHRQAPIQSVDAARRQHVMSGAPALAIQAGRRNTGDGAAGIVGVNPRQVGVQIDREARGCCQIASVLGPESGRCTVLEHAT